MAETQAEKIKGLQVEMINVSRKIDDGFSEVKVLIKDVNDKVEKLSDLRFEIDALKNEVDNLKVTAKDLAIKTNRNSKIYPAITGVVASVMASMITFLLIEYLRNQ